jgi:hypothetical protein
MEHPMPKTASAVIAIIGIGSTLSAMTATAASF